MRPEPLTDSARAQWRRSFEAFPTPAGNVDVPQIYLVNPQCEAWDRELDTGWLGVRLASLVLLGGFPYNAAKPV